MTKSEAAIRDQLGNDPEIFPVLNADYDETIGIELGPEFIKGNTLGNAWIVGSATNGLVGTNTGTVGGGQQVVGGDGRVESFKLVQNDNNTYIERFKLNDFEDTDSTADWNVSSSGLLAMTNTEVAQSLAVYLDTNNISQALVSITADATDYALQLSADGGSHWENVTAGTVHTFTNLGNDLRWKITATDTVNITFIRIQYN